MAASPTLSSPANSEPGISLSEWLVLRRHPHPEFVDSLEKLPTSLLKLVEQVQPASQAKIEGALVLPAEYYARKMIMWEYVPERALIFLDRGAIYATAAGPSSPGRAMVVDAQALLYARSSLLLLYGLLEFKADCGPQAGDVRLEYNTVIWQVLRGPLLSFIAGACTARLIPGPSELPAEVQASNAELLQGLPYKFANGLRYYALTPGEPLRAAVFQPAIWEDRRFLARQITPNTLFALTDRKIVLIEEKRASIWHRQGSQGEYGWIFTYIPLDRVIDMTVSPSASLTEITLRLEWGGAKEERAFLLRPETAGQWQRAWLAAHNA